MLSADQLYSVERPDRLRNTIVGNGIVGDVMSDDFIIPYKHTPEFVSKLSNFYQLPNPGFFTFQCVKQPDLLLNSYADREGLFTANEMFNLFLGQPGFDEPNKTKSNTHYYEVYKPYFESVCRIVKYIRPFGISTDEGLTEREKHEKSRNMQYCIYGKVNHNVYFQKDLCEGLIKNNQFVPIPNRKIYGDIYVFLGFHENEDGDMKVPKLKYFFTDNPGFVNSKSPHNIHYPFNMVLKLGHFHTEDINICAVYINGVEYYQTKGFVFCPNSEWSFYLNDKYDPHGSIEYIQLYHPKYMYSVVDDFFHADLDADMLFLDDGIV